ncbi:MAG: hypothetical protein ACK5NN_13170 [Sphingomonadaceae bacterium]
MAQAAGLKPAQLWPDNYPDQKETKMNA